MYIYIYMYVYIYIYVYMYIYMYLFIYVNNKTTVTKQSGVVFGVKNNSLNICIYVYIYICYPSTWNNQLPMGLYMSAVVFNIFQNVY